MSGWMLTFTRNRWEVGCKNAVAATRQLAAGSVHCPGHEAEHDYVDREQIRQQMCAGRCIASAGVI
jgi:hypothetical protein